MKRHFLLATAAGLLTASVLAIGYFNENEEKPSQDVSVSSSPSRSAGREPTTALNPQTEDLLPAGLAEANAARRQEILRQWADSIETGKMADVLAQMESMVVHGKGAEIRQVLLSSWIQRDRLGMATWFGNRNAVDALHAESRDLLVKTLADEKPDESLSWMEESLSKSVCQELYGPFFRQWTNRDPAAAAAKLRELSGVSLGKSVVWDNLIAQVAGQWATTDLNSALAWTKALPDSAAKSQALVQVCYEWAKRDPQAAGFYATQQKDPAVFDAVAGTWAANDPRGAATWAFGLPAGEARNTAVATAMAAWAQTDAKATAAYVAGLSTEEARNQGKLVIASSWSYQDPVEAARWVDQFPEGTIRNLALEKVMDNWAQQNSEQAGQWLQHLPKGLSRDVAVGAYCNVIDGTKPDVSFKWAATISDSAIRNQKLESAATSWLEINPAAARQSIAQSSLPEDIKSELMTDVPSKNN